MKKFSKAELKENGIEIAKANKVDKLFATEDNQHFIPKNENACKNHARDKDLKIYELDYSESFPEVKKALKTAELNVPKTVELMEKCETLEELEVFASDERKGVQKVFATMKQLLNEEKAAQDAEAQAGAEKGAEEVTKGK